MNYGQILSAGDINLKTSAIFKNHSNALNLSENDFTIKALNVINLGTISAKNNLDITADAKVINSKELVAYNKLNITAPQILNENSIFSNHQINLNANDYLTNQKEIIALGQGLINKQDGSASGNIDDGVMIIAKTLNNQAQISAKNNITINSNTLNNNTANSSIFASNDINLNVISVDNSNANIKATNNLALRNLTSSAPIIATRFGVTSQVTTIANAGGTFYSGNLLDFDLSSCHDKGDCSTGTSLEQAGLSSYTIIGSLQSAGAIKIRANNINNLGDIQSDGAIEIEATNQFINGLLIGANIDPKANSNTKIASQSSVKIIANNLLSNYATLSAQTDLSLISIDGNINNNINAEIIAGKRYQIDLKDQNGVNLKDEKGDNIKVWVNIGGLSLVAKNGTVNQNSLHSIVVNGDYNLDVVDFINTGRVDVAGNLKLNVANDLVNEERAMIYAGGNMELNVVNNLTNKTDAVIHSDGSLLIQKYSQLNSDGSVNSLYNPSDNDINQLNNINATIESLGNLTINAKILNNTGINYDPDSSGQFGYNVSYGVNVGGWGRGYYNLMYQDQITSTLRTKQAKITSGQNIEINNAKVNNYGSSIFASGDITINNGELNNETASILVENLNQTYGKHYTIKICRLFRRCKTKDYHESYSSINSALALSGDVANIKAGGNFTVNGVRQINNGHKNSFSDATIALASSKQISLIETGTITTDLSSYFSGPETNGLFQKSTNPNGPLFETRSQFIDQSKFFGSDYFYQRIGLNLTDLQTQFEQQNKRLVGDQFFQTKIIEEQLRTITKNSLLLSSSETNVNNEIKNLIDNAVDEYNRLQLTTNNSLTQTQINSLQKDIIWFETEIIDGSAYIVPKIYLSQSARNNLTNNNLVSNLNNDSTIFAKNDINLNTNNGSITNQGSIIANNNISLSSSGDITNQNFSNITALNNLSLTSTLGSITNLSQLKANNNISLIANKDITNTATIATNDTNLLNSGNPAYISNGTNPRSSGNISSKLVETAVISAGSLTINAGENFNNYGAKITTTQNILGLGSPTLGNVSITAGNDINIATVELRNRTETTRGSRWRFGTSITDTTTNIGSDIQIGGDLEIKSGENVLIKGSNLDVVGNAKIDSGNDINILFAVDSTTQSSFRNQSSSIEGVGSNIDVGGSLVLDAKDDINNIGSKIKSGADLELRAGDDINNIALVDYKINNVAQVKEVGSSGDGAIELINNARNDVFNSGADKISSELVSQGNIESGGNLVLVAGNDINNVGSDIKASGGALLQAGDDVNIVSAELRDRNVSRWGSRKKGGTSITDTTTNIGSDIQIGGDLIIASTGSSELSNSNGGSNINIIGSNLTSGGNISANAKDEVNIISTQDTAYKSESGRAGRGKTYSNQSGSVTQVESNLMTTNGGNISIISGLNNSDIIGSEGAKGSINIIASNLITTDLDGNSANNLGNGNVSLTAKENVIIASALNSSFEQKSSVKKTSSSKTTVLNIDSSVTNISSNILANDVSIMSGNNTYVVASNLVGSGNGEIVAGKYVDPNNSSNIAYNQDATINILSATDEKYHHAMTQKISTDYKAVAVGVVSAVAVAALTGGVGAVAMAGATGAMIGAGAKKSKTTTETTYDAIQKASTLTFNNNISLSSASDTNIISSDLTADSISINAGKIADANGDMQTINANANLNIGTVADIHFKENSVKKTHANYWAVAVSSAAVAGMGAIMGSLGQAGGNMVGNFVGGEAMGHFMYYGAMGATEFSLAGGASKASTEISARTESQALQLQASSNLNSINSINLISNKNLNISASNLQTISNNADINLVSESGDVNLLAGINSDTTSSSTQKHDFKNVNGTHTKSSVGVDFVQIGAKDTETIAQNSLFSTNLVSANNININSGTLLNPSTNSELGNSNIMASNLIANNQLNINSANAINIKSGEEITKIVNEHSDITNTINLSIGNSWLALGINSVEAVERTAQSNDSETEGKAKVANATATSLQLGVNILQALITAPTYGFYGSVTDTLSKTTSTTQTDIINNKETNLLAINNINLSANSDLNIKGSNVNSISGNINLNTQRGDINIISAQNSINSNSQTKSDSIAITISTAGESLIVNIPTISHFSSESDFSSTSQLASNIIAKEGILNINAKQNTNVLSSNLLAKDINLTTENLKLESLQDKLVSKANSQSISIGGNIGFSNSSQSQDQLQTNQIASIIGTNSVNINVGNKDAQGNYISNTGNTNIIGGLIANITNLEVDSSGSPCLGGSSSCASVSAQNDGGSLSNAINGLARPSSQMSKANQDGGQNNLNGYFEQIAGEAVLSPGNNLTLNTGSLTFQNLNNHSNSSNNSIGFQIGINLNSAIPSNIALNYVNNSSTKEGITKATIGAGSINIGGKSIEEIIQGENLIIANDNNKNNSNTNNNLLTLNRNINETQIITKNKTEGGYNVDLNVTPSILTTSYELNKQGNLWELGMENIGGTGKLYGNAVFGLGDGKTSADAVVGTLPWFSRWGNENNNVKVKVLDKDGSLVDGVKDYPAPNLLPAFWNEPNMGISDAGCKAGGFCKYTFSDEAPIFTFLHGAMPGADSDSGFHDAGNYPSWATQLTIPPYFAFNIIGAIGTFFDIGNWKQNFVDPNTYIFKKVEAEPVQNINQFQNPTQPNILNQTEIKK